MLLMVTKASGSTSRLESPCPDRPTAQVECKTIHSSSCSIRNISPSTSHPAVFQIRCLHYKMRLRCTAHCTWCFRGRLLNDCLLPGADERPSFAVLRGRLDTLAHDAHSCHIDLAAARANLNYENPTVIAQMAKRNRNG